MQNRRQHYRHEFGPNLRLTVKLKAAGETIAGEILNLSIGGMCVKAESVDVKLAEKCIATIALGPGNEVTAPVERVHAIAQETSCSGYRFLPVANLQVQNEQETRLWKYLLDEQRRARRRQY